MTAVLGQPGYCAFASVNGPFSFSYGDCSHQGASIAQQLQQQFATGEVCWYVYQYEDASGSSAGTQGPTCTDVESMATIDGLRRATLDYVDRLRVDASATPPDVREYIQLPDDLLPKKTSRTWLWIAAAVAVVGAGGYVAYRRTIRRRRF